MNAVGFVVLTVHTVIANMRISQGDQLLAVTRVGQNFLIPGHGCIENNFADSVTIMTDGLPHEDRAVR
jgi:hypothetical protein